MSNVCDARFLLLLQDDTAEGSDGNTPETAIRKSNKRSLEDAVAQLDEEYAGTKELTPSQKALCERTFLVHQGDCDKIALTLGAPRKLVVDYVRSHGLNLDEYQHIRPDPQGESKKQKALKNKSMKSYNASLLKRVEDAEIHPFFVPCDHSGPCTEENCSCVKNRFFCTVRQGKAGMLRLSVNNN